MRSPPTFPRITGSTRLTHALIGSVAIIGIAASIGALSGSQISFPFIGNVPALKLGGALVIMLVALLFAATELQRRSAAKLALFPALLCAFWVFQNLFHWNSFLPNAFASQIPGAPTYQGPYMAIVTSLGLLLSCLTLAWSGLRRAQRARLTCEAVIGSLLIAVGLSTFLDHVARLTAIYAWGSQHPMAPVAAIALILIGAIHLLRSWRETYRRTRSSPAWLPLFPVIICLTLSLVLSMGLQKRENVYLSSRTSATLDKLAVTIGRQMDLQAKAVEAFAARWDAEPSRTETIWQALSSKFIADGNRIGVVAISYLDNNYHRRWFHPAGDAPALAFPSQTEDPARRAALREAAQNLEEKSGLPTAVLSNTTIVSGQTSGFVIYMPDLRQGVLQGYLAVEYDYTQFFRTIINTQLNLEQDFNTSLSISGKVFLGALANVLPTSENLTLTSTYPVYGRRINISLTPTEEYLDRRRRQLPELTLLAGIGITFFLGLSIHLARVARHRQHQAERSNQRLLAENEERRRIENRLKISDERLRQALDTTQIGIFENNTVSKRVYYSPGLWSMLGYDHRQMQATIDIWESLIHPEDRATYNAAKHCQLRGRTAFIDPEYRVRGRTGAWHWIYSRLRVVSSANGLPTRILGTLQDVTARREAELSLRSSQAETRKLSLVAAKTDTPVIIGSPDAKIEWVNESFTRIMGYGLAVASGRELPDLLIGPETDPQMLAKIREAITQGIPCQVDLASYSQNGQRYYLRIEIQPVRHTSGRLENYIGILADMTARVETETQLRLAKASAEEAVRIKSEFLASMSHEIRTPMNGVIGMTNLLKETELNAEQREFVNTIHRSGEALLTIINDILDFSKIESGNLNLESLPVDLASCIEDSFDLFALQASTKNVELAYHIDDGVPPAIKGDSTRLRQILVNLISNAVKFTPSGSVSVVVENHASPLEGLVRLSFAVKDTGIGIPHEKMGLLFKAFSQVDSSTTRKYGGTGLGLVIAQRLCSLMGGKIEVSSAVGKGSTFTFSIDATLVPSPEPSLPLALPQALRTAPILCIEDHPVTRRYLESLLSHWGAQSVFALDSAKATSLTRTLPTIPSLLVINGSATISYPILQKLLAQGVPCLLLLPFAQPIPEDFKSSPLLAVAYKPLKTSAVQLAIQRLVHPTPPPSAPSTNRDRQDALAQDIPLDILLVEDNPVNQEVARRLLHSLGYRPDTVSSGVEALSALRTRNRDLVFMDLQMPQMDGYEATRQIRRQFPVEQQPKIIALTANAMHGDRERCLAAGMDDYVSKPVKLHEVTAMIRRYFPKKRPPGTQAFPPESSAS